MNVLITGNPGIGKTTIVRRVLAVLRNTQCAIRTGGFLTEETRKHRRRVGFQIVTLDTHEVTALAQLNLDTPYRIGKYGVSLAAMTAVAIPALRRASDGADLIVVDEIGRMECFAPDFLVAINECLNSPKPLLGVVSRHRLPFLDAIRDRDDVELIEVNEHSRDCLVGEVVERVRAATTPPLRS